MLRETFQYSQQITKHPLVLSLHRCDYNAISAVASVAVLVLQGGLVWGDKEWFNWTVVVVSNVLTTSRNAIYKSLQCDQLQMIFFLLWESFQFRICSYFLHQTGANIKTFDI